jgi:hypothetical protein
MPAQSDILIVNFRYHFFGFFLVGLKELFFQAFIFNRIIR